MDGSLFPGLLPIARRVAPVAVAAAVGVAGLGYAVHEHHSAQNLAAQNQQMAAQLNATHSQVAELSAKANNLADSSAASPAPTPAAAPVAATQPSAKPYARARRSNDRTGARANAQDTRFQQMQSQIDAQGKAIEDARSEARTNLDSTRTELSGSIARTHDELVVLERKGERNYYEFDLFKSKQFQRTGPIGIALRKANDKHQYADLNLLVEDRSMTQKHVNLYQPAMFYQPDSPQPVEIVINQISKDHIHGYVSASKYRRSELSAMNSGSANPVTAASQNTNAGPQLKMRPKPNPDGDIVQ